MPDVDKFFSEVRQLVDDGLRRFVPGNEIQPASLYEAIRWSLFGGGKRFRPALVFAAGRLFGTDDDRLLMTAAGVELVHTYSLIHDDLPAMDDDDLRRGRVTVHRKFGEATAILAGDALQAMAFEAIAKDDLLNTALRLQLVHELSIAAGQMVAGQQMDLEAESKAVDITSIEAIHRGKTGALIRYAVRAGCLIGGAGDADLLVLTAFGEKLGLLFQITDDILDVTATSEELGKTAGKDVANRKATYPEILGIEASQRFARAVEDEAIALLAQIGRDTDLLSEICRYVSRRTS